MSGPANQPPPRLRRSAEAFSEGGKPDPTYIGSACRRTVRPMELQSLGYIGIRARNVDDWREYGEKFLGLQLVDRSRSTLTFRMDDRRQRIVVCGDGSEGAAFFGWEVADAAALDALATRLEAAGVAVERMPSAVREERKVVDSLRFRDPAGNLLE